MGKSKSFKEEYTFVERFEESRDIIAKYPDRVPVIAERFSKSDLPEMEKKKYLVPRDMSVGQFIHILSNRLRLEPGKALFVFVKNTLPQTGSKGYLPRALMDNSGRPPEILLFVWTLSYLADSDLKIEYRSGPGSLLDSVYRQYKDEDGFLYMCYSSEKTFG